MKFRPVVRVLRPAAAMVAALAIGAGFMVAFSGTDTGNALPLVEECGVRHIAPMYSEPDPASPVLRMVSPGEDIETIGGRLHGPDGVVYVQIRAGEVGWAEAGLISCKTIDCDLAVDRSLNPVDCAGWIDTTTTTTTVNCANPFDRQNNPQECAWWTTPITSEPSSATSPTSSTPPEPTSTTAPPVTTSTAAPTPETTRDVPSRIAEPTRELPMQTVEPIREMPSQTTAAVTPATSGVFG